MERIIISFCAVHFLASSRTIMDFEKLRANARQEFEKILDNLEQGLVREAEEKKVQVKTDVVLPRLKPPPKPRHRSYLEDSPPPLPKRCNKKAPHHLFRKVMVYLFMYLTYCA